MNLSILRYYEVYFADITNDAGDVINKSAVSTASTALANVLLLSTGPSKPYKAINDSFENVIRRAFYYAKQWGFYKGVSC